MLERKYDLRESVYICYAACYNKGEAHAHHFVIKKIDGIHLRHRTVTFTGLLFIQDMNWVLDRMRSGVKIHGLAYVNANDAIRVLSNTVRYNISEVELRKPPSMSMDKDYLINDICVRFENEHKDTNFSICMAGLRTAYQDEIKEQFKKFDIII